MNTKRMGAKREHAVMKLLTQQGYSVTRAAASLGVFDIIAIPGEADDPHVRLIQVKSNRWPGPKERGIIEKFVVNQDCPVRKEIWMKPDRKAWRVIEWTGANPFFLPPRWRERNGYGQGDQRFVFGGQL